MPIKFLGPGFLLRATEYPSFHIFGFDDKNALLGHNHMIDLSGAVFCWQGDVFKQRVFRNNLAVRLTCHSP